MQPTGFVHIGFGNLIARNRILKVTKAPKNQITRKRLQAAEDHGLLITLTFGRKALSVIHMDSEHLILSYLTPEELQERLKRCNQPEHSNQ